MSGASVVRLRRRYPNGVLALVEVNDFHFDLLANGLAGVHEGAVRQQAKAIPRRSSYFDAPFSS